MIDYSVTRYGKPLSKQYYTVDEDNKVFSSKSDGLVLDFRGLKDWTFKTGSLCTFKTGSSCTFNTGSNCTFSTLRGCTFKTGGRCTFKTCDNCTFNTGGNCTFTVGRDCSFDNNRMCVYLLLDIKTHRFKSADDVSIILDQLDNGHYLLDEELLQFIKVMNL